MKVEVIIDLKSMLMPKVEHFLYIILIALLCGACGSDDVPDPLNNNNIPPGTPGSITCTIDGENFASGFPLVTGELAVSNDIYTLAVTGVDFFNQDTLAVIIGVNGTDFSSLMANDQFTGTGPVAVSLGFGTVHVNNRPAVEDRASSLETEVAVVTITNIDRTNETVSGTFSYEATDPDNGKTFNVTNGVFTDIEYN